MYYKKIILLIVVSLFCIGTLSTELAHAKGSSPDISKIKLPLRFDASAVTVSSNNTLTGYKEDYGIDGLGVGANLELPMPGIHSMLGVTGFMSFDLGESDNSDSLMFLGAYIGAAFEGFDLILGPCVGAVYKNLRGAYANPDEKVEYTAEVSGGFIGLRKNFISSGWAGIGVGIKGFYMSGDDYEKEITNSGNTTKTKLTEETSTYGGLFEITFSIGQQRKQSGWGMGWLL